jgi:hypothetical protein
MKPPFYNHSALTCLLTLGDGVFERRDDQKVDKLDPMKKR